MLSMFTGKSTDEINGRLFTISRINETARKQQEIIIAYGFVLYFIILNCITIGKKAKAYNKMKTANRLPNPNLLNEAVSIVLGTNSLGLISGIFRM